MTNKEQFIAFFEPDPTTRRVFHVEGVESYDPHRTFKLREGVMPPVTSNYNVTTADGGIFSIVYVEGSRKLKPGELFIAERGTGRWSGYWCVYAK